MLLKHNNSWINVINICYNLTARYNIKLNIYSISYMLVRKDMDVMAMRDNPTLHKSQQMNSAFTTVINVAVIAGSCAMEKKHIYIAHRLQ